MRWLAFVVVAGLALAASGCMTTKTAISGAKAGDGYVHRTRFIEI
jgi:hypothetical protein